MKAWLETLRGRLEGRRHQLVSAAHAVGSRAEAVELDRELVEIDAALGRIDDGSYGCCVDCGAPIGMQRLAAIPEVARCHPCEARQFRAHESTAARGPASR